jgi:hypothetical protein
LHAQAEDAIERLAVAGLLEQVPVYKLSEAKEIVIGAPLADRPCEYGVLGCSLGPLILTSYFLALVWR